MSWSAGTLVVDVVAGAWALMNERLTEIAAFVGTTVLGTTVFALGTWMLNSKADSVQLPLMEQSIQLPFIENVFSRSSLLSQASASQASTSGLYSHRSSSPLTRHDADRYPVRYLAQAERSLQSSNPSAQSEAIAGLYPLSAESPDVRPDEPAAFPLKHTDVEAQIQGNVAQVEVTQTFENPFDQPLEAIYVFPLPDQAAVDGMDIRVGDRTINGVIKDREDAQAIYEQAVEEGRTAGLLEQERANIFTQSLANIRPGESIDVTIRYTESLPFEGDNYEFVFPMVVGPRYIPGNPTNAAGDTDQVPDASRITPPVLAPGTRSGHDINVTVALDAGVPIQSIESPSHKLQMTPGGDAESTKMQLQLAPNDTIPNKDLIVRYQIAGNSTQTTVLTDTTDQGGHFALYLIPAVDYDTDDIVPKDVVFLMDTSGSQAGDPLAKSQELMRRMVNGLNPNDTFSIIDFANSTTRLSSNPLPNTSDNRSRALSYINNLSANGGTELLNGIREVLTFPAAERGRLRSIVLLTDGYIGNEADVLAEVQQQLADGNRLYSFGVGSGVNRFLINRLAEIGRGTAQVIRQDEPTEAIATAFFQRINNPVLTNIDVEWLGKGEAPEIYPLAAPDLFAAQPLVIFGRKADGIDGSIRITGTVAGGAAYEQTIPVEFTPDEGSGAIAQLWGRARIKDVMTQMYGGETVSGVETVTETALAYRLLSQYTAFVAVTEDVRVDPDGTRHTVQVPVELPEGVSYEGIFGPDSGGQGSSPGNAARPQRASAMSRGPAPSTALSAPPALPSAVPSLVAPSPMPAGQFQTEFDADEAESGDRPLAGVNAVEIEQLEREYSGDTLSDAVITELEQALEQYLRQAFAALTEETGTVVWQLRVREGRVTQVLWDDRLSTLDETQIVDGLRRSLNLWRTDADISGTLRITLEL